MPLLSSISYGRSDLLCPDGSSRIIGIVMDEEEIAWIVGQASDGSINDLEDARGLFRTDKPRNKLDIGQKSQFWVAERPLDYRHEGIIRWPLADQCE